MAIWRREKPSEDSVAESPDAKDQEYGMAEGVYADEHTPPIGHPDGEHTELTRGLKARHVTMIAIVRQTCLINTLWTNLRDREVLSVLV